MTIKKGDFIEMDFVGKIKDTNEIFDLTKEEIAKEKKLYNSRFSYKPVIICVGEGELIKGLDEKLVGKDKGKFSLEIKSEEGFGKKDPSLLKLVPMKVFTKENLRPFPGLNININGLIGTVRTVSGGRVIVDFNHPLSGRDLVFDIEVRKILKEDKEKVEAIVSKITNEFEANLDKSNLTLKLNLDEKNKEELKKRILKLIPSVKEVKYENLKQKEEPKKVEKPEEKPKSKPKQ
ncbi:peptidylprolyl isomerase [Candidatus Woesearchaeota archaeon]|nr:peptidylprolyl isomerase [Candidatus Woesearchaeota archaeon]